MAPIDWGSGGCSPRFIGLGEVRSPLLRGIKGDLTPNYPAVLRGLNFPVGEGFFLEVLPLKKGTSIHKVYILTTRPVVLSRSFAGLTGQADGW